MADRYLLESGAPDGYQLEDGSGVLLLEPSTVIMEADGSSAGVGASVIAGVALWLVLSTAAGVGAAPGVGVALVVGGGASVGVAVDTVVGASIARTNGASTGEATVSADGEDAGGSTASAGGLATCAAVASSCATADADSAAMGTVEGIGVTVAQTTGSVSTAALCNGEVGMIISAEGYSAVGGEGGATPQIIND